MAKRKVNEKGLSVGTEKVYVSIRKDLLEKVQYVYSNLDREAGEIEAFSDDGEVTFSGFLDYLLRDYLLRISERMTEDEKEGAPKGTVTGSYDLLYMDIRRFRAAYGLPTPKHDYIKEVKRKKRAQRKDDESEREVWSIPAEHKVRKRGTE